MIFGTELVPLKNEKWPTSTCKAIYSGAYETIRGYFGEQGEIVSVLIINVLVFLAVPDCS